VVSQGKLCIKGRLGYDFLDSKERITIPLIAKKFLEKNRNIYNEFKEELNNYNDKFFSTNFDVATTIAAKKLKEITAQYGSHSFCAIGGARTSCENAYIFQKFTREAIGSPHVDCCARVCHAPSLGGMKPTIGEGAATNPYDDIYRG